MKRRQVNLTEFSKLAGDDQDNGDTLDPDRSDPKLFDKASKNGNGGDKYSEAKGHLGDALAKLAQDTSIDPAVRKKKMGQIMSLLSELNGEKPAATESRRASSSHHGRQLTEIKNGATFAAAISGAPASASVRRFVDKISRPINGYRI